MESRDMNLEILSLIEQKRKYVTDLYIKSAIANAAEKASHACYEQHRHPDDGVGGFGTRNPYHPDATNLTCNNNKDIVDNWEAIYRHAVETFIV